MESSIGGIAVRSQGARFIPVPHGLIAESGDTLPMCNPRNVRLLLTNRCSARCAYCHNEGQEKANDLLNSASIEAFLDSLDAQGQRPSEITLSGGEPTLHPEVGEIARRCKARGIYVSMDSHGGHPSRLALALPHLDELKLHIDSFDAAEQTRSMGINLSRALESLRLARNHGVAVCVNHPLRDAALTRDFLDGARTEGVDCKIIEMFGEQSVGVTLEDLNWADMGYRHTDGVWRDTDGLHRVYTKRCGSEHSRVDTWFVGPGGIRRSLEGPVINVVTVQ